MKKLMLPLQFEVIAMNGNQMGYEVTVREYVAPTPAKNLHEQRGGAGYNAPILAAMKAPVEFTLQVPASDFPKYRVGQLFGVTDMDPVPAAKYSTEELEQLTNELSKEAEGFRASQLIASAPKRLMGLDEQLPPQQKLDEREILKKAEPETDYASPRPARRAPRSR